MKKSVIIALLAIFVQNVLGEVRQTEKQDSVVVSGTITGVKTKGMLFYEVGTEITRHFIEDMDKGFRVSFKLDEPSMVMISFPHDPRFRKSINENSFIPCSSGTLMFIGVPGSHLSINGDLTKDYIDIYPGGDAENDILRQYTSVSHPVINERGNYELMCRLDTTITQEEYEKGASVFNKRLKEIQLNFLEKNVSSIAGLWLLRDMFLSSSLTVDQLESYMEKVDEKYHYHTYYKEILKRIQGTKSTAEGQILPSVKTSRTPDGTEFDLSTYRGKYVLIDFWGTWCHACIQGMPKMKDFAAQHSDKLKLLGIAKEVNPKRWKEFLSKAEWDWQQILSGEGPEDFVMLFNVKFFPTKILVGPDGKILKRCVGEEESFYEELESLIK